MSNPVWDEFKNGGWMNWFVLLFGLLGLAASMLSVVLSATRSRYALAAGVACAALGAWIACLGLLGTYIGRHVVDEAVSGELLNPTQVEHIRRLGYAEARSCVKFGLGFAALPLIMGAIAVFVGRQAGRNDQNEPRPWQEPGQDPAKSGAPSALSSFYSASPPSAAPSPPSSGSSSVLPAVLFGVAALPVVASFVLLKTPLPGRDLDPDDPAWRVYEAADEVRAGKLQEGCKELEEALADSRFGVAAPSVSTFSSGAPDLAALASTCVDDQIQKASLEPPRDRSDKLASLKRSRLPKTDEQLRRIDQEIARASEPSPDSSAEARGDSAPRGTPPKVKMGSVTVAGHLPPEVIQRIVRQNFGRLRLCYENGLRRDPKLQGTVRVKFVIGRDGAVALAASAGSDMPDAAVEACVIKVFKGLSFPQPEGGVVSVVYPVRFAPGG
jgi:hypothetical protein